MGRIKKAAGPKHEATVSRAVSEFVSRASVLPISQLRQHLDSFPLRWPLPRGDLYHWIPLLNRFDSILASFIKEYGLDEGPQTRPFGRVLLTQGVAEESKAATVTGSTETELDSLGFEEYGDRELVEFTLQFSRNLLENCGNRSLYNSSERLGDLLNTTNLSLLSATLQLAVRLAQRYYASRQRGANASQNLNNALLASHYNIDLEKVQKLANPFVKLPSPVNAAQATTPTPKGKEKAHAPTSSTLTNANDMLALAHGSRPLGSGSARRDSSTKPDPQTYNWEEWGGIHLTYYQPSSTASDPTPTTPTPTRRNSSLSRPSRLSSTEDASESASPAVLSSKPDESITAGVQQLEISSSEIASASPEEILSKTLDKLPKDSQYELLSRVRVAHAITTSPETRQEIVGIRLLAITNLAYIYAEQVFESKILKQDSDEPHNLQLVHQLSELMHPPGNGLSTISMKLQTLAIGALEALLKHKTKAPDVSAALSINVNHGVLFYILRKALADMTEDDGDQIDVQREEWRDAVFSLLDALPTSAPRTGETLVAAGLLDILIDVLSLRTKKAERNHPRVLAFLNSFIYSVRDAFPTLANSKGLETISDLIAYEVESSMAQALRGGGLRPEYRTQVIDYQIPFFQQQTLRMLFKIINHMMTHNSGNFDRLLRNLIDSPKLLSGLRTVITNTKTFGSSVWSGAVNIMSSFIHNEPTSYAVISEAGLSKGFLEAISSMPLEVDKETSTDTDDGAAEQPSGADRELPDPSADTETLMTFFREDGHPNARPDGYVLAQGILPATDAIVTVPQAFGAICLNHSGMDMFRKSGALEKFFEIFESPDHVKGITLEIELARLLGSSFDELVRHHPNLKMLVMSAILKMIGRVKNLCDSRVSQGAKLWLQDEEGQLLSADKNLSSQAAAHEDEDVVMTEVALEPSERPTMLTTRSSPSTNATGNVTDDKKLPSTSTFIEVAMRFLSGFFENGALCSLFVESGGADRILELSTLSSLPYDFNNQSASQEIARVIHMLAEQKSHLVLPSLLQHMEAALANLAPLYNCSKVDGFFSEFTSVGQAKLSGSTKVPNASVGSTIVQSLLQVHTLCNVLYEVYSPPIFNARSTQSPFALVNLTDLYRNIIKSLGLLHRVCVWEEILLQKRLPDSWREATRIRGYGMGSEEADEVFGFIHTNDALEESNGSATGSASGDPSANGTASNSKPKKARKPSVSRDEKTAPFRNVQTLRYLLSQIPSSIVPFFQGLGKVLVTKRRVHSLDTYQRQNASKIAEAMSDAQLEQLEFEAPKNASAKDRYAYWIVILTSISQLMVEGSIERPHPQVLTLVLQAFRNDGGLDAIKGILETFHREIESVDENSDMGEKAARLTSAYGGIKIILSFYTQINVSKAIIESNQSLAMISAENRLDHVHHFNASQFLIELRMAVLPVVKSLWDSDFVDKASGSIIKCLIEILSAILEGTDEQGAIKKGSEIPTRGKEQHKAFEITPDRLKFLVEKGFEDDVAQEALYRCMNVQIMALAYCQRLKALPEATRLPIPDNDKPKLPRSSTLAPSNSLGTNHDTRTSTPGNEAPNTPGAYGEHTPAAAAGLTEHVVTNAGEPDIEIPSFNPLVEVEEADGEENGSGWTTTPPPPAPGVPPEASGDTPEGTEMSLDNLPSMRPTSLDEGLRRSTSAQTRQSSRSGGPSPSRVRIYGAEKSKQSSVTVEGLDAARNDVRSNLIVRALDVLNVHDDVTFELTDLIKAATLKAPDAKAMRGEIGATLMQALISFQMDSDFQPAGKKIAAYANLLALVLQNRDFYEASLNELKENFEHLLGFIKIFPGQPPEESSPWIGQTLVIIEKILGEDVQPAEIKWTAPGPDGSLADSGIVQLPPPLVPMDFKEKLFEALLDIMPRIGKDESLVLSVVRTLVILTRNRTIASRLGEKYNIQRLFMIIKQLSGTTNERLPGAFMVLLRHIVEDDDIIRQIMRSEIRANFDTRPNRPPETTGYIRQMYHLVLRSPEIFVEVTNDELEILRYDGNQRPQMLCLKKKANASESPVGEPTKPEKSGEASTEGQEKEISVEGETQMAPQAPKPLESKAPVVERPSGVIHYLLNELLIYKDVEDKDVTVPPKQTDGAISTEALPDNSGSLQIVGSRASTPIATVTPTTKKPEKAEFKPEQHPIYMYRLFILQCLTELLQSYNQTKIEFINFSRKADAKATTPSKPRSGVLNYLLNDVIPLGTLRLEETISFRKKNNTSTWATSTIVALCLKTNEYGYDKKPGALNEEDEPDLLFVRKFVLEHALKAYKDANAADEYPDVKYDRLLEIADLFNRLLVGKIVSATTTLPSGLEIGPQKVIAKLMFEKNFIAALTSSIADIDLNFPGSQRATKYILRPLKLLTTTAVTLSETSSISSVPGLTDEDEISSATSVSDANDEREETPDLFRNSTLGMFEPGREEESSSGDSEEEDDEMYDDEYDEGMEFDDGMERDGEDVISDEDEDLGDAGHMEGLHGDGAMDVEVMIDDDDDDDEEPSDEDEDPDDSADEEIEILDEVNGDDENASLAEGDDEWQDEMDDHEGNGDEYPEDPELGQEQEPDGEMALFDHIEDFPGPDAILRRIADLDEAPADLIMDIDNERYMDDVVRAEEDDDDPDDDDGDEDVDEEDVIYQPEYEDDEPDTPDLPYWHDPEDEPFPHDHHHHHHHRHVRRMPDPWSIFPNGPPSRGMPQYRSHRPNAPRPADDGINPLLQRNDRSSQGSSGGSRLALSDAAASLSDYWVQGMEDGGPGGRLMESPVSFVNNLIAAIGQGNPAAFTTVGGHGGAVHVQINSESRTGGLSLPRELQAALGFRHRLREAGMRAAMGERSHPWPFLPESTYQRWQEETRILYGIGFHEKALRVLNSLLRVLIPPALEKKKLLEEELKRREEQEAKLREQERLLLEESEKKERQRREQEEREAAAAAEAESQQHDEDEAHDSNQGEGDERPENTGEGMEGVETETAQAQAVEGEAQSGEADADPSQSAERVIVNFQGQQLDITNMGIDVAYLDALPEDIRNEVILSQIAVQRSQAAAAGEPPTDIDEEFLDALPPEIRAELLQQETQERRRREREEARRQQAAAGGGPPRAEEMDPASFLASLDPTLRQHVLMEQDEEMLAHLPEEIAAEARALGGDRSMHRFAGIPGSRPRSGVLPRHLLDRLEVPQNSVKKPPRKQIVQMLDKAGVATLLRLMFIPQHGTARASLHSILNDVAQNRQTRAEVISLLLSVLQDGSADVNAVERSFTQLSIRAKQPSAPKTPQTLKRTFTGQMASVTNNLDATPLMVIQQCLNALVAMTQFNDHIPSFFLTEYEISSGMKSKSNRKGKGKETRASKFALNALLGLLGRKLIMESSSCMEQLASLLQRVTQPLTILLKKDKEELKPTKASRDQRVASPATAPTATSEPTAGETRQHADYAIIDTASPMADVQTTAPLEGAVVAGVSEDVTEGDAQVGESKKAGEEEKTKKPRTLIPPVVPEENLRLVVNILAARECSAKTFRDTLSTINNLSAIPGAREIFGKALIEQAQDLGQSILNDLDELVPQIKQAESGTDLQGMALTKFSPASSDQAKLLRILTALDYLFDPKRNGGKTKSSVEDKNTAESSKDDLLMSLYENSTFGPLWDKLSECLGVIRQGDGMLNIATILLPLVEALMVVCKNTTLKDAPLIKAAKEFAVASPPPESRMESLFFNFTEEHRKILNDLVRQNPKLMSGTFSLLVKNPKVLDFDNKRNYFTRRLHSRGTEARHPQPPLQLPVRRDQVFLDSFKFLSFKSGDEIKYGKLSIRFHGEEGVDAGGVTREWFQVLSRQMFNADYALFIPVASDRTTFHPNKLSKINEEHLMFFKFIGRIIGKALYEGRALDCHFSRAVYKRILGKTVSLKDMETLDLDYYKSLIWMLENDITEIITETMSVETDDFGVAEIVDLVPNGRNIPVTEENKQEYVQLVVEYRLTGSVQAQLERFLEGFHDIVPPELIAIFNEQELELLISGLPDIDVDDWKAHTDYQNYQAASPQIQWFWRAVRSFDKEERAKLLQFVTGTSKVPLNGFSQLEGMNGFSRFNIHRDYGNKDRLPSSHTCFNQLDLPEYESYEALRHQVYTAMTAGSEYFGFA